MLIQKVHGASISKGKVGTSTVAKLGTQSLSESLVGPLQINSRKDSIIIRGAQLASLGETSNLGIQKDNVGNTMGQERVIIRRAKLASLLEGVIIRRTELASLLQVLVGLGCLDRATGIDGLKGVASVGKCLIVGGNSVLFNHGNVLGGKVMKEATDREITKSLFIFGLLQLERGNLVSRFLKEGKVAAVRIGQVGRSTASQKGAEGLGEILVGACSFKSKSIIIGRAELAALANLDIHHDDIPISTALDNRLEGIIIRRTELTSLGQESIIIRRAKLAALLEVLVINTKVDERGDAVDGVAIILLDSLVGSNGTLVDDGKVSIREVTLDSMHNKLGLGELGVTFFLGTKGGSRDQGTGEQKSGGKGRDLHGWTVGW